jgi:hypothetical protein
MPTCTPEAPEAGRAAAAVAAAAAAVATAAAAVAAVAAADDFSPPTGGELAHGGLECPRALQRRRKQDVLLQLLLQLLQLLLLLLQLLLLLLRPAASSGKPSCCRGLWTGRSIAHLSKPMCTPGAARRSRRELPAGPSRTAAAASRLQSIANHATIASAVMAAVAAAAAAVATAAAVAAVAAADDFSPPTGGELAHGGLECPRALQRRRKQDVPERQHGK